MADLPVTSVQAQELPRNPLILWVGRSPLAIDLLWLILAWMDLDGSPPSIQHLEQLLLLCYPTA